MNRLSIPSNFEAINNQYLQLKMTDINSVLIIGNIASGKSTFAADFSKLDNFEIIELDAIRDCEIKDIQGYRSAENEFLKLIGKPKYVCVYVGMGLGERGQIANLKSDLIIRIHASEKTCFQRIEKRINNPPYAPKIDIQLLRYISETLDKRGYSVECSDFNGTPLIHFSSGGL